MSCTGLLGRARDGGGAFDVEVIDVIDDHGDRERPADPGPGSGPAIDETGMGPGFSGSPILLPGRAGRAAQHRRDPGAIGEYGGEVVLATPIEAILGSPVDAPRRARADRAAARARAAARRAPDRHGLGLAARRGAAEGGRGRAGARARRAGRPARPVPGQPLRPGSAFGVGLLVRRHRLARPGPSPTSTATGCGASGTRSRASAPARCCCRTPTSSASSTTRSAIPLAARTSSRRRGTTSGRSPTTRSRRWSGASAGYRRRCRCASSRGTSTRAKRRTVSTDVADESGVDQPTAARSSRGPARGRPGGRHGARRLARAAHRPRVLRRSRCGSETASAVLQPLRDRPSPTFRAGNVVGRRRAGPG